MKSAIIENSIAKYTYSLFAEGVHAAALDPEAIADDEKRSTFVKGAFPEAFDRHKDAIEQDAAAIKEELQAAFREKIRSMVYDYASRALHCVSSHTFAESSKWLKSMDDDLYTEIGLMLDGML